LKKNDNQVRIIGGKWRGRKIHFPLTPELRPTPDRVRETLFNWLAPKMMGATCLDLFAGSGALSFEALSRGAYSVVALEKQSLIISNIQKTAGILAAENLTLLRQDALTYLKGPPTAFDIVFIDPPYKSDLLGACLSLLTEKGWLKEGALLYFESDLEKKFTTPPTLNLLREKKAGKVCYFLAQYTQQGS
jgi:16S rRNA (guanine966-N2)-methyltransferase